MSKGILFLYHSRRSLCVCLFFTQFGQDTLEECLPLPEARMSLVLAPKIHSFLLERAVTLSPGAPTLVVDAGERFVPQLTVFAGSFLLEGRFALFLSVYAVLAC